MNFKMNKTIHPPTSAIIVAGGTGSRFGGERPKQLAPLAGLPILTHTLKAFSLNIISEIILVLPSAWREAILKEAVYPFDLGDIKVVEAGETRSESTKNGLLAATNPLVLIHDGVRPLVERGTIEAVAQRAWECGAALAATPVYDTLKKAEPGQERQDSWQVVSTVDRRNLWQAQTPQGFRRDLLLRALDSAKEATDDIALVEALGYKAVIVPGSPTNLKITTFQDLLMAEALFPSEAKEPLFNLRIGHGYDLHRLVAGRDLWLGGVKIPFELGLLGHSDADVLAHALIDALYGAAALGDIGMHFPDSDPAWKGAPGLTLLAAAMAEVRAAGFELINADLTLIGERPKIGPYRAGIISNIAKTLEISPQMINLKATTTEGLDATGKGLALAAQAVVLLRKR